MNLRDRRFRPIPVLAALLLVPDLASADQLVFGRKLLIRNPPSGPPSNKVVHLAKDPSITMGVAGSAGDPQCSGAGGGGTSSLSIAASGGAGDLTLPLPCAGWTTNGANNLYTYTDTSGATCERVLVKGGVTKAVCKGTQVTIDLNGAMSPVSEVLTLNTERYCTEFGGTVVRDGSDDRTFLSRNAGAPGTCPPPPTTTTSSTSTTTTVIPPSCSTAGASCGSCGGGVCHVHNDADTPALVCVAEGLCAHTVCSDDAICPSGSVCVVSVGTACCPPCF